MSITDNIVSNMREFIGVPYVYGGPRGSMATALTGTDCSGAVIASCKAAGAATGGASYTGDMRSCFTSTGEWSWHIGTSGLRAGDVLLYDSDHPGHTAVWDGAQIIEEYPPEGRRTGFYEYADGWDGYLRHESSSSGDEYYGTGGTYRVTEEASPYLNVRTAPSLAASTVASYYPGETVVLQGLRTVAEGYVWGQYVGMTSGQTRYVAIAREDASEIYLELV